MKNERMCLVLKKVDFLKLLLSQHLRGAIFVARGKQARAVTHAFIKPFWDCVTPGKRIYN